MFWSYSPLNPSPKSYHIHPFHWLLPMYPTLSFFPTALGSGACPGMLVPYQESQKTDSPSPSTYKTPKASQIEVRVCAFLLYSVLAFVCLELAWVLCMLSHTHCEFIAATALLYLGKFPWSYLPPLALTVFQPALLQRSLSLGMEGCDVYICILLRSSAPWPLTHYMLTSPRFLCQWPTAARSFSNEVWGMLWSMRY